MAAELNPDDGRDLQFFFYTSGLEEQFTDPSVFAYHMAFRSLANTDWSTMRLMRQNPLLFAPRFYPTTSRLMRSRGSTGSYHWIK